MRTRLNRTVAAATLAGIALLTVVAGCGSDGGDPEPLPPVSSSPTTSSPTTSPTPSAPAWESKFTQDQLAEYEDALNRWSTYEQRSEPIWAGGKATPAAQALFKEFFLNPDAQFQTLQTYESVEVTTEGIPKVYWSKALKISDPKTSGTKGMAATIQQCVDYREVKGMQRGKPTQQAKKFQRPVLRQINMTRLGTTWLIANIDDRKGKPCGAEAG